MLTKKYSNVALLDGLAKVAATLVVKILVTARPSPSAGWLSSATEAIGFDGSMLVFIIIYHILFFFVLYMGQAEVFLDGSPFETHHTPDSMHPTQRHDESDKRREA